MHNPNQHFPGPHPYPYQPMPVTQKTSFGLALSAAISGVVGIAMTIFIFSLAVSGNQGASSSTVALQEIAGLVGLLLVIGSGVLSSIGIIMNKSRIACIVILGLMSLPIMIALWLLTVLLFTALGIG